MRDRQTRLGPKAGRKGDCCNDLRFTYEFLVMEMLRSTQRLRLPLRAIVTKDGKRNGPEILSSSG